MSVDWTRTVYKYPLAIDDAPTVIVDVAEPKVVHVGLDPARVPCVWVEQVVGADCGDPCTVRLYVHGTGHPVHAGADHVGSFVRGPFVWHVYQGEADPF